MLISKLNIVGVKKYVRNLRTEIKARDLQNHGSNLGSLTLILI